MNIYDEDLKFDPDKAAAELRATPAVSNKDAKRETVAIIQTAALIDIADSLRTLAIEAAIAMAKRGDLGGLDPIEGEVEFGEVNSLAIIDAPEGTRVTLRDNGYGSPVGTLDGQSGIDQGTAWVGVVFQDGDSAARVWAHDIVAVAYPDGEPVELTGSVTYPDGTTSSTAREYVEPEVEAPVADAEPAELEDHLDDIDADFEGDEHGRAEAAVKALKARERAAKKTKGTGK